MYNDVTCRLCQENEENVNHILNECEVIVRNGPDVNIYSQEEEEAREIVGRTIQFLRKIEEIDGVES